MNTLYRSQFSTHLHQTCQLAIESHEMWLPVVLVEIRNSHVLQTGSEINFHHCSISKLL